MLARPGADDLPGREQRPVAAAGTASGLTCPGDRVVRLNTVAGIYHVQDERYYGRTRNAAVLNAIESHSECSA